MLVQVVHTPISCANMAVRPGSPEGQLAEGRDGIFTSLVCPFGGGGIKDRNGMDLMEAEDIKNRWQEYTAQL